MGKLNVFWNQKQLMSTNIAVDRIFCH
jgi:hypothetical protein